MEVIEKLRKAKKRSEVIEVLTELRVLGKEESVTGNGLVGHRFFQTLSVAIDHLGQSLLGLLTTREQKDYLSVIFIEGPAIDSFLVLTKSFNNVQHYTADKLLMCLGEFLKSRQAQMLETICSTTVDLPDRSLLDRLSQAMVGLPEKVANHYKVGSRLIESCGSTIILAGVGC